MDGIPVKVVLDRGARYLGNHPDHLAKRIVLAQLLVDARLVKTLDAGLTAFKLWSHYGDEASADHVFGVVNSRT